MHESSMKTARDAGITSEMQSIVRSASEPVEPRETVGSQILRASRKLGISYRRARTYWYGYAYAVRAHEADAMRRQQLRLLADRERRLSAELALIRATLDAQTSQDGARSVGARDAVGDRPAAGGETHAAVAWRDGGGGSEEAAGPRLSPEAAD